MNLIKETLAGYLSNQALLLKNNHDEIESSTKRLALVILSVGCLVFLPFIVIALVIPSYKPVLVPYIVELTVLSLLLLCFIRLREKIPSAVLIYIMSLFLFAYATYSSVHIYPQQICVLVSFILFQLPILTMDKSLRVNLVVLGYSAFYIVAVILFKSSVLVPDEVINCLLFSVFGMLLGELLRQARLENFELKRLAVLRGERDLMTGLYSKGATEQLIEQELEQSMGTGRIHALIGIDVDDFKNINDKYGHGFGDMVLRELSAEMSLQFRERDIVGRVGGDEFAVLMLDFESVMLLNEKLGRFCEHIAKKDFGFAEGEHLSISMGAATFPTDGTTYSKLFEKVDEALYYAKACGKNTFHIYGYSREMTTSFRLDSRDLKGVLETTTDGIAKYACADRLLLLYFNKKLADLMGGETGALSSPGFDPYNYVHPADLSRLRTALNAAIPNREPIDEVFRHQHQTKKYIWVRLKGYFINELYQGKHPIFYGVYTDLSVLEEKIQEAQYEINSD